MSLRLCPSEGNHISATLTFLSLNPLSFLLRQSVSGSHLKLWEARKSKWLAGSYQFLNQGLNPSPQQWKHEVLTTGWPGNSLSVLSTYFSLYSLVLTSQKLRVLMLRFLKGEANSSWLMWQIYFKFCHYIAKQCNRLQQWTQTIKDEKLTYWDFFFCLLFGYVFFWVRECGRVVKLQSDQFLFSSFRKDFLRGLRGISKPISRIEEFGWT